MRRVASSGTSPRDGDVLLEGRTITAVAAQVEAPESATVINARHCVVIPGLVDGHRHVYASLLRGSGANLGYLEYFEDIVVGLGGRFTPRDSGLSAALGAAEAIDSGITTLHAWEHNLHTAEHGEATFWALADAGLRGRFSYGPPNMPDAVQREDLLEVRDRCFGRGEDGRWVTADGRWDLGLATRGVEHDDLELWSGEFAFAREHGLPVTAHFLTAEQFVACEERDALGPDLLAVHVYGLSPAQMRRPAETGTPVCVAIPANARTALGRSPIS